ncbi:MAG: VOC family protein [Cytophagales bacterium]|nr:VOC family protein [Bernardetiaceae bacterium]MDW8205715.1 VOC family protein [Cytophagales bacterium]
MLPLNRFYGFTVAWLLLFSGLAAQAQGIGIVAHNHIALQVADIEASKNFYGNVLGLKSVPVPDNLKAIRAWFQVSEQHQIHLLAGRTQPVVNDKDGSHFALFVADIAAAERFLQSQKIPYHAQTRFDGVRQIYLADPDGYLIELNQRK